MVSRGSPGLRDLSWRERQATCPICQGTGLVLSPERHAEGRGAHAWAARCVCQPMTLHEIDEAIQEADHRAL